MMSEELATVRLGQVPNYLKHIGDGFLYRGWTLDLWIKLVEHFEHEFAYFGVTCHGFGCCESVRQYSPLCLCCDIRGDLPASVSTHPGLRASVSMPSGASSVAYFVTAMFMPALLIE
jgi:hypothetical protein